eukprot:COSAG02_NODE_3415_length_6782_cov_9.369295_2_plen_530_part_00
MVTPESRRLQGMWLQICLVLAGLLSHYQRPYVLRSDNRQEQMSFLGLSLVLTITNSGVTYSGGWRWYHVCVVVFVVLIMTASMFWIQFVAVQDRSGREERVSRAEQDLRDFTRRVFSTVVPGFLLLKDEHRAEIRERVQVETFTEGETIYREGDPANSFYIIKEGLVTISSTQEGRTERTIQNGESFGAGALEIEPRRRVATAVVASKELLCLRLIRPDWLRTWMKITDDVAMDIFKELDSAGEGQLQQEELESYLLTRWNESQVNAGGSAIHLEISPSGSENSLEQLATQTVSALMQVFDDDGDGTISAVEFKRNLRNIPADDYVAANALDLEGVTSPLPVRACPFKYFHVDPKTNRREPYSDADNDIIFGAQSTGQVSVRLSNPGYEVRFGANAISSKVIKPCHTGMCQVNLENDNTRVVERLDALDSDAIVRVEAAPVAAQKATTDCVYRWPSVQQVIASAQHRQRTSPTYYHVDPTTNRRVPYSPADNLLIMTAENQGKTAVRIADTTCPHSGETLSFEVSVPSL